MSTVLERPRTTTVTEADVFSYIADTLEQAIWGQGFKELRSADSMCASEARVFAFTETNAPPSVREAVFLRTSNALRAAEPRHSGDLVVWNDRSGRTKDEVVGLFRRLAEEADGAAA